MIDHATTGDSDLDGDTLSVSAIRTGTEAGSGTSGTVGAALTGTYGTLTLNADGSYSYVADQAAADALAVGAHRGPIPLPTRSATATAGPIPPSW